MNTYHFYISKDYEVRSFERSLAIKEIESLINPHTINSVNGYFEVRKKTQISKTILNRFSFFESVKESASGDVLVPAQNYLNRLPKIATNGGNYNEIDDIKSNKREHSYLTHSLHAYTGKYYPQLVNSLFNWCGLSPGDKVLDPFCGSGTTLVEATIRGIHSVGVDMNPLACVMADVKSNLLIADSNEIHEALKLFLKRIKDLDESNKPDVNYCNVFDEVTLKYLKSWFPEKTLFNIAFIASQISQVKLSIARNLLKLILSDKLRDISFQDPTSLRVLRRKDKPCNLHFYSYFCQVIEKRLSALRTFDCVHNYFSHPYQGSVVHHGDIRNLKEMLSRRNGSTDSFDAAITSPPYATALPYIDTDRLSLLVLGLMKKHERKDIENNMIGNREITTTQKRILEQQMLDNHSMLPVEVKDFIQKIYDLNKNGDVGFRRKNTAALLYKYFSDMADSFRQVYSVLKNKGRYAVVIGNNTTVAGNKYYEIPTDDFLTKLAIDAGFKHKESIPMTDQVNYMRHSKNMIRTETIILLEK